MHPCVEVSRPQGELSNRCCDDDKVLKPMQEAEEMALTASSLWVAGQTC
jgi:hypothetical protein